VAGGFSALALLLASLGLYGIASYSVVRRTRELGIRIAIGETRASILRRVLRDGVVLVIAGIGIGGPVAVIAMRSVRSLLFDVAPTDTMTIAAASATLIAVGVAATIIPARRAAAVDPIIALRTE
jgi:ABC-type antimicrobial peptide transport system permease subunit